MGRLKGVYEHKQAAAIKEMRKEKRDEDQFGTDQINEMTKDIAEYRVIAEGAQDIKDYVNLLHRNTYTNK